MPTISREFRAHYGNYTPSGNRPRYIVVHYTANTASARQEATYASNDQHPSSYHFVLDGSGVIYQLLDVTDTAWAVGGWAGTTQLIGNNESVSIEVCNDGSKFTTDEVAELRWLVRKLMVELGIPASRVVRHYDCHSGRKACPYFYTPEGPGGTSAWYTLRDAITKEDDMSASDVWNYKIPKPGGGNVEAWSQLTWGAQYAKDMQPKVASMYNAMIEMKKQLDDIQATQTTMQKTMTTMQKAIAAINKKLG